MQQMAFEEEAINKFQKEKSYQLELLQIKQQEEMAAILREQELRT